MEVKERKLKEGVYYVGAMHWDRRLFDDLIPLPDGTSYNAYIIKGTDKIALIDTVDPVKFPVLKENLKALNIKKIDYVIANHAEQDHSGSIPHILDMFPSAKVVTNEKCKVLLMEHLLIPEDKFLVINEGETLSLGDKTLQFLLTPWVHWPETMITYLIEDRILFTCDFFGSHLATTELFTEEDPKVKEDAKRYYAEIMMPFRTSIKKNIEKVEKLNIDMIAPSHGPIYKKPEFIIESYKEWISDKVENIVLLPYVSMHGSVEKMAHYFMMQLVKQRVNVEPFNLTVTDTGKLAMSLVDAATIVLGSPTVLAGAHPAAVYAAHLVGALRPKTKFISLIGSYGWGGMMIQQIQGLLASLKAEFIEPVLIKGYPKTEDLKSLEVLATKIAEKHRSIGIL